MAENSNIQWTTHTFSPWRGCTKVSPGCAHCYAEAMSGRNPGVLGVWGPNGTRVVAAEAAWREPLKWDRKARAAGERHRVFCAHLSDVFEDWQGDMVGSTGEVLNKDYIPAIRTRYRLTMDDVRHRLFRLIGDTPNLDWLLLTKRPANILPVYDRLMTREPFIVHDSAAGDRHERWTTWKEIGVPPTKMWPNVWIGTSVENQAAADERIPELLKVPAAVRFLSCEPLLGPVDLGLDRYESPGWFEYRHRLINWVIVGGESGPGARPMHLEWARRIVGQCKTAGVPVFVKQMGANPRETMIVNGVVGDMRAVNHDRTNPKAGDLWPEYRDKKGGDPAEWPADLRVRELPHGPSQEVARGEPDQK